MPKGYVSDIDGEYYDFNLYKLVDSNHFSGLGDRFAQVRYKENSRQFCNHIFDTDKECIDYLKTVIIDRLRGEGHKQRKDKAIKISYKKVWYV